MGRIKKWFFIFALCELFLGYASPALAQVTITPYGCAKSVSSSSTSCDSSTPQGTIEKYLCAPTLGGGSNWSQTGSYFGTGSDTNVGANNKAQGDLYICINKLYRFAIVVTAVVGVLMIVIGGYLYISSDGNQESVDKAKSMLVSSIAAMIILMIGYIFLKALNPDLIKFQPIQPPSVALNKADAPTVDVPSIDGGVYTGPTATAPTGNAQNAAKQILNSSNISLATGHASGNSDNATARQNVVDASQGNAAQRSSYTDGTQKGPGGTVAISDQVLQAIIGLSSKYSFSVSEITGGVHSANSDHYAGRAFDVNTINGSQVNSSNQYYKAFMNDCKQTYGANVVLGPGDSGHATHVHCGWTN